MCVHSLTLFFMSARAPHDLIVQRDEFTRRFAEALAVQHELEHSIAEYVAERDQLLRVIDDLSLQHTSKSSELQSQLEEREQALLATQEVRTTAQQRQGERDTHDHEILSCAA